MHSFSVIIIKAFIRYLFLFLVFIRINTMLLCFKMKMKMIEITFAASLFAIIIVYQMENNSLFTKAIRSMILQWIREKNTHNKPID